MRSAAAGGRRWETGSPLPAAPAPAVILAAVEAAPVWAADRGACSARVVSRSIAGSRTRGPHGLAVRGRRPAGPAYMSGGPRPGQVRSPYGPPRGGMPAMPGTAGPGRSGRSPGGDEPSEGKPPWNAPSLSSCSLGKNRRRPTNWGRRMRRRPKALLGQQPQRQRRRGRTGYSGGAQKPAADRLPGAPAGSSK